MNTKHKKTGFTLVEILVAMALILTVISIVYGSYFAASKSAQTCKAKLNLLQQMRIVLDQMARQISCTYVSPVEANSPSVAETSQVKQTLSENSISYFKSNPSHSNGEILHLVTTRGIPLQQQAADGLFDVTYKFDRTNRTLFLSQERFISTKQSLDSQKYWLPLLNNVESVELEFFDGKQWLRTWDFDDAATPPLAAKIQITCEDENHRKSSCSTAAYVACSEDKSSNLDLVR